MRIGLGPRLAFLMAVVGVVPLAISSYHAVGVATERAERTSDQMLEGDARRMSAIVEVWLDGRGDGLAGWLDVYPALAIKPAGEQAALLRAAYLAQPDASALVLVDDGGEPIPGVPAVYLPDSASRSATEVDVRMLVKHLPVAEVASRAREAAARGQSRAVFAVGQAFARADGGVAVPIATARPSDPSLILGASVDAGAIFERLTQSQVVEDRVVAWLDSDGRTLFAVPAGRLDAAALQPILGLPMSFALKDAGLRGALAPVAGTDWSLVVAEASSVTARPSAELRWQTLAVAAVSALLALLLGLVSARWISEPVQDLRASALRLADGDFSKRATILTNDELGELAEAFNHMADRLETTLRENADQRTAIESFNADLQDQIAVATSDLREAQGQLVHSGQLAAVAEVGAGLAHELNNPLTAILGLAQLLAAEHGEDPRYQSLNQQVERCRQVVATMVRVSSDATHDDDVGTAQLSALLPDVVASVRPTFRQRGVTIDLAHPEARYAVSVGPVMARRILAQVLHTLCAGLQSGQSLEVCVLPGVGVLLTPSAPLAEGRRRDDWRASGLGLWVVRQLLARIGGALREPEGDDVAWRVLLPAERAS